MLPGMLSKLKQPAMIIAILALFASMTGGAIAAKKLTGKEIRNGSLSAKDLSKKARKSLRGNRGRRGPQGLPGIQGTKGARGEAGATGARGAAGANGAAGAAGTNGLAGPMGPTGPKGPTGDDGPVGPSVGDGEAEYGVVKVFAGDTALGTLWTPDVPDDGNNAGVVAGNAAFTVDGTNRTISVRGIMRTGEPDGGQIGGGIIVRTGDGQVVATSQTPVDTTPGANFNGLRVVAVDAEPLTSGGPSATDTEVITATVPGTVPDGTLITVEGTVQAFDFND